MPLQEWVRKLDNKIRNPYLRALHTNDIFILSCVSNYRCYRSVMERQQEVMDLRKAWASGEVTEADIRGYVDAMFDDYQERYMFPWCEYLIAVAVALETERGPFVGEFLHDLALLSPCTFGLLPYTAKLCYERYLDHAGSDMERNSKESS